VTLLERDGFFEESSDANRGAELTKSACTKHPRMFTTLKEMRVQRRKNARKPPGFSKERAQWKSLAHSRRSEGVRFILMAMTFMAQQPVEEVDSASKRPILSSSSSLKLANANVDLTTDSKDARRPVEGLHRRYLRGTNG